MRFLFRSAAAMFLIWLGVKDSRMTDISPSSLIAQEKLSQFHIEVLRTLQTNLEASRRRFHEDVSPRRTVICQPHLETRLALLLVFNVITDSTDTTPAILPTAEPS